MWFETHLGKIRALCEGLVMVVGRYGSGTLAWWWETVVVGCFCGGHHIAQQLCPDNVHMLAWRQMGINFPVASFLLP